MDLDDLLADDGWTVDRLERDRDLWRDVAHQAIEELAKAYQHQRRLDAIIRELRADVRWRGAGVPMESDE